MGKVSKLPAGCIWNIFHDYSIGQETKGGNIEIKKTERNIKTIKMKDQRLQRTTSWQKLATGQTLIWITFKSYLNILLSRNYGDEGVGWGQRVQLTSFDKNV